MMLVYRGQVPTDLELELPTLRGSFSFPIKYGYASVGRVVEVGSAARDLTAGDLQAAVAAVEAFIGLLIEIVLIATFTQRFFAR